MPVQNPITISTQRPGASVNIQFISRPEIEPISKEIKTDKPKLKKTIEPQPKNQEVPQKKTEPTRKIVEKTNKKPIQKKVVNKSQPVSKPPNRAVKKNVEKSDPQQVVEKRELIKLVKDPEQKSVEKVSESTLVQAQSSQPKLIKKPSFTTKPSPIRYPRVARKRGVEGKVVIEIWLDESGLQTRQIIHTSSGHELLDKTALAAVAKWKFKSHQEGGHTVSHRVRIPVNFKLD
ncbi:energy transducer TonB [Vibrio hannami]|uniref:energy transducer TonB n=1 Tax=Vibrio hannami TaxID=2717094 RepID=UPI00240FA43F|nr:energy transducer TonB [Vibrio hannami]MDG3087612.1 energy transducer TonB [Vibrio hannami]